MLWGWVSHLLKRYGIYMGENSWKRRWVYQQFQTCVKCDLWKIRHNVVVGRGVIPAQIVLIGEAPGQSEDLIGTAFIGRSGKVLDKMILDAEKDVGFKVNKFFTNAVLCFPADCKGCRGREPYKQEIETCQDNVVRIIHSVNPDAIVYCGNIAERAMKKSLQNYKTYKIYHPSHVLRQGINSPKYYHNVRVLIDVIEYIKSL